MSNIPRFLAQNCLQHLFGFQLFLAGWERQHFRSKKRLQHSYKRNERKKCYQQIRQSSRQRAGEVTTHHIINTCTS